MANTAVAVGDGKDVVVAKIILVEAEANITLMAVAPMEAVDMAEAVLHLSSHITRPNSCAIDVVWIIIGLRHVGLPNISLTSTKRV